MYDADLAWQRTWLMKSSCLLSPVFNRAKCEVLIDRYWPTAMAAVDFTNLRLYVRSFLVHNGKFW